MRGFPHHARAAEAETARRLVHETAGALRYEESVEAKRRWLAVLDDFYACLRDAKATVLYDALARLRRGDAGGLDLVLGFLEADPLFSRSGYMKEGALRALKRVALEPQDGDRLRLILVAALHRPARREFRDYCLLAAALADVSPGGATLRAEVAGPATNPDAMFRHRAGWMLAAIDARHPRRGRCGQT